MSSTLAITFESLCSLSSGLISDQSFSINPLISRTRTSKNHHPSSVYIIYTTKFQRVTVELLK